MQLGSRFRSSHDTQCLGSIPWSYLWVFCVIKCPASKFEVSLFPPLEGAGLLQQLSLFNAGLGTEQSTTTGWKPNPEPNPIQNLEFPTPWRTSYKCQERMFHSHHRPIKRMHIKHQKVKVNFAWFPKNLQVESATDWLWETESHCLQLCTHWRIHQAPLDSPKPKATQTAPVKLSRPPNKTKDMNVRKRQGWGQGREGD